VTGGYASANVKRSQALLFDNGNDFVTAGSDRKEGWTIGGGVEFALFDNWIVSAEYLHIDLDDDDTLVSSSALGLPQSLNTTAGDAEIDIVRAGLSYKFN
jgi:outer membrane immunogenic protein